MDDLYPDTRKIIEDRVKANESLTGDYEKDIASGAFKPMQLTNYDFGLNAEGDAISRMAKRKFYDPAISNLKTQEMADYAGNVQRKLMSTQKLALGQMRYDNARHLAAQQRASLEEAQRAAMIGSLFQVAGAAAGAYLGGPWGAMIGAQATQSATPGRSPGSNLMTKSIPNPTGHSGPYRA